MDPGLCNPSTDEERAAARSHFNCMIATNVMPGKLGSAALALIGGDDAMATPSFPDAAVKALLGEPPEARPDWEVIAAWEPQPLSGADEANVALDGVKRALAGPLEHPGMLGHLTIVRTHLEAALMLVAEAAKKLAAG